MKDLIQGSREWLEARKSFVTATDSPVIMKLSPFLTPYALWRRKMDLDPPEVENQAMKRGTELEPIARNWLFKQHGIKCNPIVITKDFMMASLDGISTCETFIVEIKCGDKSFREAEEGRISNYYHCQMMHQMHCSNVDYGLYIAFNGHDGIIIRVERDQEFINEMIEKEREFYQCLIQFTPPMMTTRDYLQRLDTKWIELAERYQEAYQNLKKYESIESELRNELICLAGSQSSQGSGIKLSKVPRKGAIDYSKIQELKSVNLEEYRKPNSEYWRLSVE